MPRAHRLLKAGHLHHVVAFGNNHSLFTSSADFIYYARIFEAARQEHPVKVYNYCLTDRYVHFLLEPQEDDGLPKLWQKVSRKYAGHFNKNHDHAGHVFQRRYKSFLVQPERYFFVCSRYIDLTPVKSGAVKEPSEYPWSGFATLAHGKESPIRLDFHELYTRLGSTFLERRAGYRALVFNHNGGDLNLENRRQVVLGDPEFKARFKSLC